MEPEHQKLADSHRDVVKNLAAYVATQNKLNAKCSRHLQYDTAAQRDAALKDEIAQVRAATRACKRKLPTLALSSTDLVCALCVVSLVGARCKCQ